MISEEEILNARILIVDDQKSNVQLLEHILADTGYACIASTTDPLAVVPLHLDRHFDLILLDLQMPGMDGFQVMEELKKTGTAGYLPVLVITAQPLHKLRALASGAKDFIAKPFDLTEMKTRIHNMLETRLLYKQLEKHNKTLEGYNQMLGATVLERTAELKQSEARFERLGELPPEWNWEQSENGNFVRSFAPVRDKNGIPSMGRRSQTREDQGALWNENRHEMLDAKMASRQPFLNFVYSRVNPDGSLQYLMVSGEPLFDISGNFTGYRGTGKDVTEAMRQRGEPPVS